MFHPLVLCNRYIYSCKTHVEHEYLIIPTWSRIPEAVERHAAATYIVYTMGYFISINYKIGQRFYPARKLYDRTPRKLLFTYSFSFFFFNLPR